MKMKWELIRMALSLAGGAAFAPERQAGINKGSDEILNI